MTSFANQIRWVLFSYVGRPIVLGLVALGIFFGLIVYLNGQRPAWYAPTYEQFPWGTVRVSSQESLNTVRARQQQALVDAIDLRALWLEIAPRAINPQTGKRDWIQALPDEEFYVVLTEFPNLRIVLWDLYPGLAGIQEISELQRLEYLSINFVTSDAELSSLADHLRRLPHLRQLEIGHSGVPLADIAALSSLDSLESLIFTSRFSVNDDTLAEIARLPDLRELVLAFHRSSPAHEPITSAGFAALARSPSLRQVYVGGYLPEDQTTLYELAAQSLGGKMVKPAVVARQRSSLVLTLFPLLFWAAAVGLQLSIQFIGSKRRVMPRFVLLHAIVGTALMLVLIGISSWLWIRGGASIAAALLLPSAYLLTVMALTCKIGLFGQAPESKSALSVAVVAGLFSLIIASGVAFPRYSSLIETLARHPEPIALFPFAFISLIAVGLTVQNLRAESVTSHTEGSRPTTLEGILLDRNAKVRDGRFAFHLRTRERNIESLHRRPFQDETWWQRLRHWRMGNPPSSPIFAIAMLVVLWCTVYAAILLVPMKSRPLGIPLGMYAFVFAAAQVFATNTAQIGMHWRLRCRVLSIESLHPIRRDDLLTQLIQTVAFELVVPSAILAVAITFVLMPAASLAPALSFLNFVPGFLTSYCLALGLVAVVVVVRQTWFAALLGYLYFCAIFGGIFAIAATAYDAENPAGLGTPYLVQLLAAALGIFLSLFLGRKWFRLELGLR